MNRLLSDVILQETNESCTRGDFYQGNHTVPDDLVGFSVFAPLHYEPDYSYPLLVWLHGSGQNENHLRYVMPRISMRNYVAVAPRGNIAKAEEEFTANPNSFTWCQTEKYVRLTLERVLESIEHARQRFHIHSNRIFLAGSGSGGTMAVRVGMSMPEHFCGIASLGGSLPTGNTPFLRLLDARRLPLLLSVDRDNPDYPDSIVCANLRLLHTAGMTVTLRQYPPGDFLSDLMLSDVDRWMMETIEEEQQAPIVTC